MFFVFLSCLFWEVFYSERYALVLAKMVFKRALLFILSALFIFWQTYHFKLKYLDISLKLLWIYLVVRWLCHTVFSEFEVSLWSGGFIVFFWNTVLLIRFFSIMSCLTRLALLLKKVSAIIPWTNEDQLACCWRALCLSATLEDKVLVCSTFIWTLIFEVFWLLCPVPRPLLPFPFHHHLHTWLVNTWYLIEKMKHINTS